MRSKLDSKSNVSLTKKANLPKIGSLITSKEFDSVPVNFTISEGRPRWITYAVFDAGEWKLSWQPYEGLAVFLHKGDFNKLRKFPYVMAVEVTHSLKRAVVARVITQREAT